MTLLETSLKKAFIDKTTPSMMTNYDPEILINQPEQKQFLLTTLQNELDHCVTFFFSVAFVTQDGLNALKVQLADLAKKGIRGKLLTSTYLYFNSPETFESLLTIPNLEVRLSTKKGFHAKGYLFQQADYHTLIVGSSNLTMNALKLNYEWNIRLTSYDNGEIIHQVHHHMDSEWEQATLLSEQWLISYRKNYALYQTKHPTPTNSDLVEEITPYIAPNKMQKEALGNLKKIREEGNKKALVISATGTGKTYLAAFDTLQYQPKRFLFIVHREQILQAAKKSFQKIIGGPDSDFGILSGHQKQVQAKYLFATIQTISKNETMNSFDPTYFDYILIDEVHKSGASSYTRIIDYFQPNFLLGMTATPERSDQFNIFELFDYTVAYEIRLQDALEENMLCPFHYFGVTDYEKNGELISETTDLQYLVNHERVDFLLEKIQYYGCFNNQPKGLVFCSRVKEAEALAKAFNDRGLPSRALDGSHSIVEREEVVSLLEKGDLHYIFTVDVFNEGIDIPSVNQVVLLRNTQSSIIFIQQLGRGLRKYPNKKFVTVIDFIGNYKNNYLIPTALSGDKSLNKNNLRKDTFDTTYISGLSAINFEHIAKDRIFKSIDTASLDSMRELRAIYFTLKNRINRIPMLYDFYQYELVDPVVLAQKCKNYPAFLTKIGESQLQLSKAEQAMLTFLSVELLPGQRKQELVLLKLLLKTPEQVTEKQIKELFNQHHLLANEDTIESVLSTLSIDFYAGGIKTSYQDSALITKDGKLTPTFKKARENPEFVHHVKDIIKTALHRSQDMYPDCPLTIEGKYRRRDVLRMLNCSKQMVDQNIGGYTYQGQEFVIFVTLEKGEDFKGSLVHYEDAILDPQTILWFTKAPRTLESPEVRFLKEHGQTANIHFFVKKKDDHGIDFYYLGKVKPKLDTIQQVTRKTIEGKQRSLVKMKLHLEKAINHQLYHFLTH
ncbi:DUF3427 domain-containing protein [Vagococcus humatus]|uniref:DUF3427 domain-containing protein n=1 Tax=Vagococcus humatus TaxID=1889241 RepID=A0A3R9ZVG8_9ENTE|nr:DEAD/DEAH box helicase [Vagococcus humatus]RST88676.1 DUF3427 domain-containing protein [Vagococcus humatus]